MLTDYTISSAPTEGIYDVGINGIDLAVNISIDSTIDELVIAWAKLTYDDSESGWGNWAIERCELLCGW